MATIDISSLADLPRLQHGLVARLARVRRRVRLRLLVEGTAIVLAEAAGMALFGFWADHTFRLGVPARISLLIVAAVVLVVEVARRIVLPLVIRLDLVALAGAIGRTASGGGDDLAARVASVLELPGLLERHGGPSAAMIERAVRRRYETLGGIDFGAALNQSRLGKMLAMAAAAIAIPTLLALIFPDQASLWARRMFLASHEPWPQSTYLEVADVRDGRIQVPRGEPYVLRARAHGESIVPEKITLTIRGADKNSVLMKEFGKNDFRHDFAVIEQPL
ncbi:MAG TPA: hypothetical protein VKB78_05985, partial [Pirellulales bacterium]|nr:hypothetical protein [Pirellulales bacterium]